MNIPVCFLYECFSFDSKVGVLTWKRRPESHFQGSEVTMKRWNGKNADKAAGTSRKDGRVAVCLNYYGKTRMIYASRIIFAMINGISSITNFALPMMVGVISGCYSTIFVAAPFWTVWQKSKEKRRAKERLKKA